MNRTLSIFSILGGILLAVIGAFYTVGLFFQFGKFRGSLAVDLIGFLALGLAPLALGLLSIWYGYSQITRAERDAKAKRDAELETKILQLARAHPRGLTAGEYATRTSFSVQEVEEKVGNLYVQGVLDMEVTEDGEIVYKLRALP